MLAYAPLRAQPLELPAEPGELPRGLLGDHHLSLTSPSARVDPRLSGRHIAYWITSSARCSSDWGMVSPSALAVLRLMTSSNFVGCSTGRSPGFAPFRILSTNVAMCR